VNNQEIPTYALIDCGATGNAFMDQDFARHHQIPLQNLKEKRQVEVINGRPIQSGDMTRIAQMGIMIQDDKEQLPMAVMKLGHDPIVLRIPSLWLHDVTVHFVSNTVTFGSQYCTTHHPDAPVMVQGVTEESLVPVDSSRRIFEPQIDRQWPFRGNIVMLNGSSFFQTIKKGKLEVFNASLYDINKAIEAKDLEERPMEEIVPEQYHDFLPLFNKVLADRLPPNQPGIDHEVRL